MRGSLLLAVAALSAVSAGAAAGQPRGRSGVDTYPRIDDPVGRVAYTDWARTRLELRRAGGPRPEVLRALLLRRAQHPNWTWIADVPDACEPRLVDCGDFVAAADKALIESPPEANLESGVQQIRRAAVLQTMAEDQRRDVYARILSRAAGLRDGPVAFHSLEEVAGHALDEGMFDLAPAIGAALERTEAPPRGTGLSAGLAAKLEVARSLAAEDYPHQLLALVRTAAEQEVAYLERVACVPVSMSVPEPDLAPGLYALKQLRRLDPPGVVAELKEILALYDVVRRKTEEIDEHQAAKLSEMRRGPLRFQDHCSVPDVYLDNVGWQIAEVIGDLGDRDAERQALGGRTLWNQVHEAELELVRQGKLKESEMVSAPSEPER